MKQFLFSLILISALFTSCTPKEVAIEKQLIGHYTLNKAQCGSDTTNFFLHTFTKFELLKDGIGYDGHQSNDKAFEWVVIGNDLEVCYTTSSISVEIPFRLSGDTLILSRSSTFCPHLTVFYVRN
jgi:hypothetical protein